MNSPEPLHIGIIACSAEGAALCYRTICTEGPALLGPDRHPEITLHTPPLSDYVTALDGGDLATVAALMAESADRLASAGADLLICPDNTIHQALPHLPRPLPRPFLHIAEIVANTAAAAGYRRLALTGTRWLVDSSVYPDARAARGIDCILPTSDECDAINRFILEQLVAGIVSGGAERCFQTVISRLKDEGCDAVILGCTEIPLLMNEANSPLPPLDSTRLLARAALRFAITHTKPPTE